MGRVLPGRGGGSVGPETLHSDSFQPRLLSGPEWHRVALMNVAAGQLVYSLTFSLTLPEPPPTLSGEKPLRKTAKQPTTNSSALGFH